MLHCNKYYKDKLDLSNKMAIDNVLERATIKFGVALEAQQAEGLLLYLARELPGNIYYRTISGNTIYGEIKESPNPKKRVASIEGAITQAQPTYLSESFQFLNNEEDKAAFDALRFKLTPDLALVDYKKEVLDLWDGVRNLTEQYFEFVKESDAKHRETIERMKGLGGRILARAGITLGP